MRDDEILLKTLVKVRPKENNDRAVPARLFSSQIHGKHFELSGETEFASEEKAEVASLPRRPPLSANVFGGRTTRAKVVKAFALETYKISVVRQCLVCANHRHCDA